MKPENTEKIIDLVSSLQAILKLLIKIEKDRNKRKAEKGEELLNYSADVPDIYEKVECPFESAPCFSDIYSANPAEEAAKKA